MTAGAFVAPRPKARVGERWQIFLYDAASILVSAFLSALLLAPPLARAQFFPPGALPRDSVQWYAAQLKAMEEPSLLQAAAQKAREAYRFTWLRTFHAPYAFRLEVNRDGSGLLVVKSASGRGGYAPGQLVLSRQVALDAVQVRKFTAALAELGYWRLPATDPSVMVLDGAQWILEGVKSGRYHVVDRSTPGDGPYRVLLLGLVALSGVQVEPVY